jgi:uncharacterized protein YaaQ
MSEQKPNALLIAVVQAQDVDKAQDCLEEIGLSVARLPSVGGFLGRRNATLFIALPLDQAQIAYDTLQENCRQRVEYISTPMESAPFPMPNLTPVTIGGATIFSLEIDHFEVL